MKNAALSLLGAFALSACASQSAPLATPNATVSVAVATPAPPAIAVAAPTVAVAAPTVGLHAPSVAVAAPAVPGAPHGKAPAAAVVALAAPSPTTMEVMNPTHAPCPAGWDDQGGLVSSCNKSCKTNKDCTAPFTCESLGGDPPHNCIDMKNIHSR